MEFSLGSITPKPRKLEERQVKVLILGSGPAGSSAALYAARADLAPVVLTGLTLGGQAAVTNVIENYPGFPDGVGGTEIGDLFKKQAERFGAEYVFGSAVRVDFSQRPFRVESDAGYLFLAQSVIIAMGADPVHLNIPGEKELTGRGVSYCGTCDGWFFKDKRIVVVGGGDSALEESLFLTRFASQITIIHRRDQLRAGAILQKRAKENPKIDFLWNSVVTSIEGDEKVKKVIVKNVLTSEVSEVETDGVFVFIGHKPNTSLFQGQLKMNEFGFLETDIYRATNIAGVYAAGEVADSLYKQVVTSAGMGAEAAIQVTRFLEND